MKRKVIQLAGKTSVVSLPQMWVKKFGIKKGDEIELIEKANEIVIKIAGDSSVKKAKINLEGVSRRVSRLILSSLHRRGFDEIEVIGGTKEQIEEINNLVKDVMLGFIVSEQTSKKVLYKNMYQDHETDFENILRRAFLITIKISEETTKKIKEGNFKDIKGILDIEMENNKLTNFCERILCKSLYASSEIMPFHFTVVWNLEKLADQYKYICNLMKGKTKKIDNNLYLLSENVHECLKDSYSLYFNFGFDKMTELNEKIKNINEKYSKEIYKSSEETMILFYLLGTLERIKDFFTSLSAIYVKPE